MKYRRVMVETMRINKNKGFTLLEALIAFFILSVGMLGIASLQVVSLKAGKTAVFTSVAVVKAEEILESMRINPAALATYASAGAGEGTNNACGSGTTCSSVLLAQDDIYWWKKNIKSGLPDTADTTTKITLVPAAPPSMLATATVNISWKERDKDGSGGVTKSIVSSVSICTAVPC